MKTIKLKYKKLLIFDISFSLVYNLVFLSLFVVTMKVYPKQIIFFFSILLLFLLAAQSIKNFIYLRFFSKYAHPKLWKISKIDKIILSLTHFEDVVKFISYLVNYWKLPRFLLVSYLPKPKVYIVNKNENGKWLDFRRKKGRRLLKELQSSPWVRNVADLPSNLKNYLYSNQIVSIVPLVFRGSILGFLGFPIYLDNIKIEFAERLSQRIAIIIKNKILKENLSQKETFERELMLARRVESFLIHLSTIHLQEYLVRRLEKGWSQKYFPAIFETNKRPIPQESKGSLLFAKESSPTFIFLCRLANYSHKAMFLQLFTTQGYFLSLVSYIKDITELILYLHKAILVQEKGRFQLEGFLLSCNDKQEWELYHFGQNLFLIKENKKKQLQKGKPLGSTLWKQSKPLKLKKIESLTLGISNFSLVEIRKTIKNLNI